MLAHAALLSLALLADPTPAPEGVVGPDERFGDAMVHHERGKQHFESQDFVAAAVEFQEAHALFFAVAPEPGPAPARRWARSALSNAATSFSRAEMPVEARAAFGMLLTSFGDELPQAERAEVAAALARLDDRIGAVVVRGVPDAADVRVDGRVVKLDGERPLPVAAGAHALEVRASGMKPWSSGFDVVGRRQASVDVRLVPSELPASVRIEATIQPAFVELDGADVGTAPVERVLRPGEHKYTIRSENYRVEHGTFAVAPGERTQVRVAMLPSRAPLGLRIEPGFAFVKYTRDDTPFNTQVGPGEDFKEGSAFAAGATISVYYNFQRRSGIRAGFEFRSMFRPLNPFAFGLVSEWCPGRLSTEGLAWCPIGFGFFKTGLGGGVGAFSDGENLFSGWTKVEAREGPLSFSLSLRWDEEAYKRSTTYLYLPAIGLQFGVGVEL